MVALVCYLGSNLAFKLWRTLTDGFSRRSGPLYSGCVNAIVRLGSGVNGAKRYQQRGSVSMHVADSWVGVVPLRHKPVI